MDLQIRLSGQLLILLESKLGNTCLGKNQLDKCAAILQDERDAYGHVRLAPVAQFDRKTKAEGVAAARQQVRPHSALGYRPPAPEARACPAFALSKRMELELTAVRYEPQRGPISGGRPGRLGGRGRIVK